MDCYRVLTHFYPNKNFFCIDTYETLEWMETEIPKPTKQEVEDLYESIVDEWMLEDVRQERNILLAQSDFRVVADYPNREAWLSYRQLLRDFPSIWLPDMPFPKPPTE
jgi:hypothetical protein